MTPAVTDTTRATAGAPGVEGPACPPRSGTTPAPSELPEVVRVLAEPMRWGIVTLLAAEQLCVCHLQEALDAKQTLVSHHLRALRAAGLVETEPCGRFTYYRLRTGALDPLRDLVGGLADAARQEPPRRPC